MGLLQIVHIVTPMSASGADAGFANPDVYE
jgi:hypothetical protein